MLDNARKKLWLRVAVTAVCSVTVTACGSSSKSSVSSTSSSGSASGGGNSAEVSAAKQAIAPFLDVPTKINQQQKLTGKPPTDKPWVLITCELPQCKTISDGALDAAKTAGVQTKLLSYKTTDGTTLTSAMKQALTEKPFAVSPIGFSQSLWDSLQSQYKAANIPITPIAVGDTMPSDIVTTGSASQLDYTNSGARMADFVIADSNASAHILQQDVPAFAVLKAYGDGFKSQISKGCSKCKVQALNLAPAQLASNGVVPAIVSALQRDPSIKYLVASDGAFLAGISPALKAAQVTGVKIMGGSPDINNLQALKDGSQTAWTAAAEDQYGWVGLDIAFRKALKMAIPPGDGGRVEMIATKDNVGTPSPTGLAAPSDYRDQYKKLWGMT